MSDSRWEAVYAAAYGAAFARMVLDEEPTWTCPEAVKRTKRIANEIAVDAADSAVDDEKVRYF